MRFWGLRCKKAKAAGMWLCTTLMPYLHQTNSTAELCTEVPQNQVATLEPSLSSLFPGTFVQVHMAVNAHVYMHTTL